MKCETPYTIEKKADKTKINIVGISEGAICCGQNKPVDTTIDISNKTSSANDPSIQCDICQAIIKEISEELADGIPSEDICAEVCSEVCLSGIIVNASINNTTATGIKCFKLGFA